jgi:hypothetical protein
MENSVMNKVTSLLLLLPILSCRLQSQDAVIPEKKIYISPEGKTYVNKSQPIYIRLSSSPDKPDNSLWLKGANTAAVASPIYFLQEGRNVIMHPWAVDTTTRATIYPLQNVVFEVYADGKPPKTIINYSTGKTFAKSGKVFINGRVSITLKATDELSGVENIYYSLDGRAYAVYVSPLELNEEHEYLLSYYAADHVGNAEKPKELHIYPDLTAPQTMCEINGDRYENILSGRSKIILKAEDKGIGVDRIVYRIDSSVWHNYQQPVNAGMLEQGEHTLTYYAIDQTGNREEEEKFIFNVDKTPPVMVQELVGKSFIAGGKEYASGKTLIKITTFDNKAGVKDVFYSINNAAFVRYEKPFYPEDVKGDLILRTYALDNVGNRSESTGEGESVTIPYFDLSGPVISHAFTGPSFILQDTVFISAKTGIILKATDNESGISRIEYSVNGLETMPYSNAFSLEKEGLHKVDVTAYDNVENTGRAEFEVKLDNTGPEIAAQFSIRPVGTRTLDSAVLDVYPMHTLIFLSCIDASTGCDALFYSLNATAEKKYTAPIGGFTESGRYKLKIRAQDKLGNESLKEISFVLEK